MKIEYEDWDWSNKDNPVQRGRVDKYNLLIEAILPDRPVAHNNRRWTVKRGEVVIATGLCLGSASCDRMIALALMTQGIEAEEADKKDLIEFISKEKR